MVNIKYLKYYQSKCYDWSESALKVEDKNNQQNYTLADACYKRIPYEFEEREIKQFIHNSRSMAACRLLEKQWEIDR